MIRFSLVIASSIFLVKSVSNLISLFVRIPISLSCSSTIGTPDIRYLPIRESASPRVLSFVKKNGSTITPCSERFTLSTSRACSAIVMFLCMIPIPPSLATAIAIPCSVTVSIPALTIGIFSFTVFAR